MGDAACGGMGFPGWLAVRLGPDQAVAAKGGQAMTDVILRHCAPVLAGIKTGNLVRCPEGEAGDWLARERALLRERGVEAACVCRCAGRMLLLMYRPAMLARDFADPRVDAFLRDLGYAPGDPARCVLRLTERFRGGAFPHEVGLFLGYPLEDVVGFIEHGGRGYKLCGAWKVYGDAPRARRMFSMYAACTRSIMRRYQGGMGFHRLVAANG